jgi:hypothetical protein
MEDCTYYTTLSYDGVTGASDNFVITLVGVDGDATRAGNISQCPAGKRCTETSRTTFNIAPTTGNDGNVITYELTPMPFKIPWSYYASSTAYKSNDALIPYSCYADFNGGTLNWNEVPPTIIGSSPYLPLSLYPTINDAAVCNIEPAFEQGLGTQTPLLVPSLGDYGKGFTAAAPLASFCDTCVKTKRRMYGSTSDLPYLLQCECREYTPTGYISNNPNTYSVEIIDLAMDTPSLDGTCTVYQIGQPYYSKAIDLTVSTEEATYISTVIIDSFNGGSTTTTVDEMGNAVLHTNSIGSSPVPDRSNNEVGPDYGSLLVLCPGSDGTLADITKPQSCDADSDGTLRNLWFYIPQQYASYYGTEHLQYGASAQNLVTASNEWLKNLLGPDGCYSLDKILPGLPGIVNPNGTYYDRTPTPLDSCSITQKDMNLNPIFDADEVCYKSVSLQTMYSTMVHSPQKDQWTLPGVKSGDISYSIVDGSLVQVGGADTDGFITDGVAYTVQIDVADTFMKYLPSSEPSGHFQGPNSVCTYTNETGGNGTLKTVFCNDGYTDGETTPVVYTITADCYGAVSLFNNSLITRTTNALATGECITLNYQITTNLSNIDDDDTNTTYCIFIDDMDLSSQLTVQCIALPVPPGASTMMIYIFIGGLILILFLIVGIIYAGKRYLENFQKKNSHESNQAKKTLGKRD